MGKVIIYFACFIAIFSVFSCRKKKNDSVGTPYTYASQIQGKWLGVGNGCGYLNQDHSCGDVYITFEIKAINDSQIIGVIGDTLTFKSIDKNAFTSTFKGSQHSSIYNYSRYDATETLVYNYKDRTISDDYDRSGVDPGSSSDENVHILTPPAADTQRIKTYMSAIDGSRWMTGTVNDTNWYHTPQDTMYTVNENILFSVRDSFKLHCNVNYAMLIDPDLHFRAIDDNSHTITFQTWHSPGRSNNETGTVIYNYQNNTLVFDQVHQENGYGRRAHLEQ